ncbi:MAG: hypothetical protein KR126chlam1_00687 [Chlamydiae bacterium]|nr:hypothetical protein [Chlamydiota bacterium]
MKKTSLSLGTLALLSPLALQAGEDCCPPRNSCCEDCCHEQLFVEQSQLFLTGEFLYWTVEEGAVDYAIRMNKETPAQKTAPIGDYKSADFEFDPGFRVSLGWYNCPKYWELTGQYTWLKSKGSDSASKPDDPNLFLNPTWSTFPNTAPYVKAESSIELKYQLGDLYVARVFDPNPHLRMRFIGGLTVAVIEQDWDFSYTNEAEGVDRYKNEWCFTGGGVRLGTTIDWFWGYGFYLTGRVTVASLVGSYENKANQTNFDGECIRAGKFEETRFSFHTQFLLGPSWQCPCDCWSFELFAGYEFNSWFNLHEVYRIPSINPQDDPKPTILNRSLLGMHGLTVRLTLGF